MSNTGNISKDKSKENNNKDIFEKNSFLEFSSTYSLPSNKIQQSKARSEEHLNRIIPFQGQIEKLEECLDSELYDLESYSELSEINKDLNYEIKNNNIFEELKDIYNAEPEKTEDFLYLGFI